jgi:hypothetical protein
MSKIDEQRKLVQKAIQGVVDELRKKKPLLDQYKQAKELEQSLTNTDKPK